MREETARQPLDKNKSENQLAKTKGISHESSNENLGGGGRNREERKPWRRDLTSMTWSPVIF